MNGWASDTQAGIDEVGRWTEVKLGRHQEKMEGARQGKGLGDGSYV